MHWKCTIVLIATMTRLADPEVKKVMGDGSEKLEPINPNHLAPEAPHVCHKTEKVGFTMLVSLKKYIQIRTDTLCFKLPPRCTKYRQGLGTKYETITEYRDREYFFCCDGYKPVDGINHCIPICEHDCMEENGQGYCVTPGVCKCEKGFGGRYCQSECTGGKWGANCTNNCTCGPNGDCDPYDGTCTCHKGYTGINCTLECVNSFGPNCIHSCKCENNATCDIVDGKCTCAQGFYGPYCHKECSHLTLSEIGCEQTCPCQNGGVCDDITGACTCPPGYKGSVCAETCSKLEWGSNCAQSCVCNFGRCNVNSGECMCDFGYAGKRCEIECQHGYYGIGCLTKCECENNGFCYHDPVDVRDKVKCECKTTGYHGYRCSIRDCPPGKYIKDINETTGEPNCTNCTLCNWNFTDSCHPKNGSCICSVGYKGDDCSQECDTPYYGEQCQHECVCKHGECHHVTGNCTNCHAGYIGEYCNTTCPNRTWGVQCQNRCECLNGAICSHHTGYCDCKPGFYGLRCESNCGTNKYGPHCEFDCKCPNTSECNAFTGECHCLSGYIGPNCSETCPPGFYGYNCRLKCDCNEKSSICDPLSGHCECRGGWYGLKCKDRCHPLRWGPYCSEGCDCNGNGICDPDTGSCYCDSGYYGDDCNEEAYTIGGFGLRIVQSATQKKVANMVVPGIVLFCCFIFLFIYSSRRVWRKEKLPVASKEKKREMDKIQGRENSAFGIEEKIDGDDTDKHPSPVLPPVVKCRPSLGNYAGMTDVDIPLSDYDTGLGESSKANDVDESDDLYGEAPVHASGGSSIRCVNGSDNSDDNDEDLMMKIKTFRAKHNAHAY